MSTLALVLLGLALTVAVFVWRVDTAPVHWCPDCGEWVT